MTGVAAGSARLIVKKKKNIGIISESSLIDAESFIFYWTLPLSIVAKISTSRQLVLDNQNNLEEGRMLAMENITF